MMQCNVKQSKKQFTNMQIRKFRFNSMSLKNDLREMNFLRQQIFPKTLNSFLCTPPNTDC